VNRQLMATTRTIGQPKVEVLRKRLLDINPAAHIEARHEIYTRETAGDFQLDAYDYIIDAIDSLEHKCHLILHACRMPGRLFSSMGAALKMDPTAIRVAEFWRVEGCPLARALRNRMKRDHTFPARKFQCVFSPEVLPNKGATPDGQSVVEGKRINGTLCHATAIFGFTLAGLVIQDITQERK
jgi:tRNA A37 threonylcarbamoyladenosine dehydratase